MNIGNEKKKNEKNEKRREKDQNIYKEVEIKNYSEKYNFNIVRAIEWLFGGIGAGIIILSGQFIFDRYKENDTKYEQAVLKFEKAENKANQIMKQLDISFSQYKELKADIFALKNETAKYIASLKTLNKNKIDIINSIDSLSREQEIKWKDIKWKDIMWDKEWDKKWSR